MSSITFEVGHRTTHGFPLIIGLATAALLGFVLEISRPVKVAAVHEPAAPVPPVASELLVPIM